MKKSAYVRLVLVTAVLASCNQYLRPCEDIGDRTSYDYPRNDTSNDADTTQCDDEPGEWGTVQYDVYQNYWIGYYNLLRHFRPFAFHRRPGLPIGPFRLVRSGFGLSFIHSAAS